jgi:hypothetical protein
MVSDSILPDLLKVKELIYDPCGFEFTDLYKEQEGKDYSAHKFKLNDLHVIFRVAKITPTKIGQFVTIWKRPDNGAIKPYDSGDDLDLFVVSTRKDEHFGQFIFPKSVLLEQGILSQNHKGGKLAFRVYPPWDETTNKQAGKTQKWQLDYFLSIPLNQSAITDIKGYKNVYR